MNIKKFTKIAQQTLAIAFVSIFFQNVQAQELDQKRENLLEQTKETISNIWNKTQHTTKEISEKPSEAAKANAQKMLEMFKSGTEKMKQFHEENSKQFENKSEEDLKSQASEKNMIHIKNLLDNFRSSSSSTKTNQPQIY